MRNFEIRPTNEIDMALLGRSKTPLPQLMLAVRNGLTLAGRIDGKDVAVCIVEMRDGGYEIIHLAVLPDHEKKGYGRELLLHTLDYIRFLGGETAELGAGNANVRMFTFLQQVGFRVTGVISNYYIYGNERPEVENAIINRDMIRYTADLAAMAAN